MSKIGPSFLKTSASGDLSETKVGLKTDEEYLAELVTTCTKKAADFKDRQKVRAEELVAIQEATKAMSEIAKPALLQEGTSLAQLKQSLPDAAQVKVAQFLQKQATEIKSNVLAALAQRARANPMGKVKEMIEKLILRLEDQATAETTKKVLLRRGIAMKQGMVRRGDEDQQSHAGGQERCC